MTRNQRSYLFTASLVGAADEQRINGQGHPLICFSSAAPINKKRSKWYITIVCLIALLTGPVYAGGKLLGANVEVTDSGAGFDVGYPDVAANGNTVYAVWLDDRDSYNEQDVFFSKSTDGGATRGNNVSRVAGGEWRRRSDVLYRQRFGGEV